MKRGHRGKLLAWYIFKYQSKVRFTCLNYTCWKTEKVKNSVLKMCSVSLVMQPRLAMTSPALNGLQKAGGLSLSLCPPPRVPLSHPASPLPTTSSHLPFIHRSPAKLNAISEAWWCSVRRAVEGDQEENRSDTGLSTAMHSSDPGPLGIEPPTQSPPGWENTPELLLIVVYLNKRLCVLHIAQRDADLQFSPKKT